MQRGYAVAGTLRSSVRRASGLVLTAIPETDSAFPCVASYATIIPEIVLVGARRQASQTQAASFKSRYRKSAAIQMRLPPLDASPRISENANDDYTVTGSGFGMLMIIDVSHEVDWLLLRTLCIRRTPHCEASTWRRKINSRNQSRLPARCRPTGGTTHVRQRRRARPISR